MAKRIVRPIRLYGIKSNVIRRSLMVLTFPLLFIANIVLALLAAFLWCWQIQEDLFASVSHYWKTSERLDAKDTP